jgi:hypothetical protein
MRRLSVIDAGSTRRARERSLLSAPSHILAVAFAATRISSS